MIEDKINNQIKTLEKELMKWENIIAQNESSVLK